MLRNAARENLGEDIDEYSVIRGERLPSLSSAALHCVCTISESMREYACASVGSTTRERNSFPERTRLGRVSFSSSSFSSFHHRRRRRYSDVLLVLQAYVCHVTIGREEIAASARVRM